MRQSIEKQQETKLIEASVTVMFHGSQFVLGRFESFRARESAAPSLSDLLAVRVAVVPGASSLSADLRSPPKVHSSCPRTRRRWLMQTEKFSAEGQRARSALAILVANPNTRSTQAASTVITPMTEQRRCAAA